MFLVYKMYLKYIYVFFSQFWASNLLVFLIVYLKYHTVCTLNIVICFLFLIVHPHLEPVLFPHRKSILILLASTLYQSLTSNLLTNMSITSLGGETIHLSHAYVYSDRNLDYSFLNSCPIIGPLARIICGMVLLSWDII